MVLGTAQDLDEDLPEYPFEDTEGNFYHIQKVDLINSEKQIGPHLFEAGTDMNKIYDLYEVLEKERRKNKGVPKMPEPKKSRGAPKEPDQPKPTKAAKKKKVIDTNEWLTLGVVGVLIIVLMKYK